MLWQNGSCGRLVGLASIQALDISPRLLHRRGRGSDGTELLPAAMVSSVDTTMLYRVTASHHAVACVTALRMMASCLIISGGGLLDTLGELGRSISDLTTFGTSVAASLKFSPDKLAGFS